MHSLATALGARKTTLDNGAGHVRAANAVLEGNHGQHVAKLRTGIHPLSQRYEALGKAYKQVGSIIDDYANAVSNLAFDATNLQSQVDDDTYRWNAARQNCLMADPTFPGQNLPWDYAPPPYSAPNMPDLSMWHTSLGNLTCSRTTLAGIASRRQELDEQTATKLRALSVDGPGVKQWLQEIKPAWALGSPSAKVTMDGLKVSKFLKLTEALKTSEPADQARIAEELSHLIKGTGIPGKWLLDKIGITKFSAVTDTLEGVGRWLGPIGGVLGIGFGLKDLLRPEHDGWRGTGDRIVGGVSIVGGTVAVLLCCGVVSAPVGLAVGVGTAAIVGLWKLGNAAYDNWDSIEPVLRATGHAGAQLAVDFTYYERHQDALGAKIRSAASDYLHDPSGTKTRAEQWVRGLFSS